MKAIGVYLKDARTVKKFSRATLSEKIKIKPEFIELIETEQWEKLPDYPVVVGFVKNIAGALGLDPEATIAILRRDYPPKKISVNPKPDEEKFHWSPRLTFLTGVVVIFLLALGYLGYQYKGYVSPPSLTVDVPTESQIIESRVLTVTGKSDPDSTVIINNQPALLDNEGNFSAELEIIEGTKEIKVSAKSRAGKETVIVRTIEPRLNNF